MNPELKGARRDGRITADDLRVAVISFGIFAGLIVGVALDDKRSEDSQRIQPAPTAGVPTVDNTNP